MCTSECSTNGLFDLGLVGGCRGNALGFGCWERERADPRQIRSPLPGSKSHSCLIRSVSSFHEPRRRRRSRPLVAAMSQPVSMARAPRGPRRRARHHPNQIKEPNSYHHPSIHGQAPSTDTQTTDGTDGRTVGARQEKFQSVDRSEAPGTASCTPRATPRPGWNRRPRARTARRDVRVDGDSIQ